MIDFNNSKCHKCVSLIFFLRKLYVCWKKQYVLICGLFRFPFIKWMNAINTVLATFCVLDKVIRSPAFWLSFSLSIYRLTTYQAHNADYEYITIIYELIQCKENAYDDVFGAITDSISQSNEYNKSNISDSINLLSTHNRSNKQFKDNRMREQIDSV